jgi:hypothetical protein
MKTVARSLTQQFDASLVSDNHQLFPSRLQSSAALSSDGHQSALRTNLARLLILPAGRTFPRPYSRPFGLRLPCPPLRINFWSLWAALPHIPSPTPSGCLFEANHHPSPLQASRCRSRAAGFAAYRRATARRPYISHTGWDFLVHFGRRSTLVITSAHSDPIRRGEGSCPVAVTDHCHTRGFLNCWTSMVIVSHQNLLPSLPGCDCAIHRHRFPLRIGLGI